MHLVNSIYRLLQNRAETLGSQIALVDGERSLTYGQLLTEVNRLARGLIRIGVRRGQRVGIHLAKSAEEVVASLAVAAIGGVFVNIGYQSVPRQVRHILDDCGVCVLISVGTRLRSFDFLGHVGTLVHVIQIDHTGTTGSNPPVTSWIELQRESGDALDHPVISRDLAALLYTSGSTGLPKGVMVSHANLLDGARIVSHYLELEAGDRILSVPPLSFDYGLNQLFDVLWVGGTLVLQKIPMPTEIVNTIQQRQVTVLPMVAPSWVQLLRLLLECPAVLPSLRIATNTGGRIPGLLLEQVPAVMPGVAFFLMYGLTEAFRSTYLPPDQFREKMGAIGIAIPDNEIFIINEQSGICGPGETGELVHRGSLVSLGYWGRPELSAERIRPNRHLAHLIGDEPVVHSGDLVRRDADGVLWFEGRSDDMIKCSGFRISPTEIEEVASGIEHVRESVAFGVDHPNLGQVVHLAVSMEATHYDEARISAAFRKSVPSYMMPVRLYLFTEPLPRTGNGKINRPDVVRACRERLAGDVAVAERIPR